MQGVQAVRRGVAPALEARIARLDWGAIERSLGEHGWATTPPLLAPAECEALIALYADERRFRSRVDMARYRFGVGEYKYLARPLPPVVETLRERVYTPLARIASGWETAFGSALRYPPTLAAFLQTCAEHGQTKPTPLLLRYEAGGYNCLHQDLYGDVAFPLQLTCLLSRPGEDFTGGEFLLMEQRPRAQSRVEVVPLEHGGVVIFATRYRPVQGTRGFYRATLRHGVSPVRSGLRYTLGVIFHDAK
jgi:hypothetical protein